MKRTTCRVCKRDVGIISWSGLVATHTTAIGVVCEGSDAASNLDAAIERDNKLSPAERRVYLRMLQWLNRCRGWVELSDGSQEPCTHPICQGGKRR